MKEHPIIFSSEMVRAILDGRKTQTRRIVKFLLWPEMPVVEITEHFEPFSDSPKNEKFWSADHKTKEKILVEQNLQCPYGQVGDRLWVRETHWVDIRDKSLVVMDCEPHIAMCKDPKATDHRKLILKMMWNGVITKSHFWKKKPSRFMPKWAARIFLEITNIRVERVQDISEKDAVKEGLKAGRVHITKTVIGNDYFCNLSARKQFLNLWNSLNAKRGYGWDKNPWCWCIAFKRIEK